jgi:mono/diheme cytochrome c family protein
MDDFRKFMYTALIAFILLLVVWLGIVYISACGFTLTCRQGQPIVARTPVPTLAAATLPAPDFSISKPTVTRCRIAAVNLIGDWISAGYSETKPFAFTDIDGRNCEANFMNDVQPLFLEANLWYPSALACAACHQSDISIASAQMDLSSYQGMLMGSLRASQNAKGEDIFGGGDWKQSKLYDVLYVKKTEPLGRPPNLPVEGPIIFAGQQVQGTSGTTTESAIPTPDTGVAGAGGDQIARPSNSGGPGDALNLTGDAISGAQIFQANCLPCHGPEGTQGVPNPGTDDGSVPTLNPIDPTMVSSDYKTFAYNIDLFVQHGSTPAGPNPAISMPAWGDQGALTQQQIADVVAYVISLNK